MCVYMYVCICMYVCMYIYIYIYIYIYTYIHVLKTNMVYIFSALTMQFVCHQFLDYHDPTIGELYIFQSDYTEEVAVDTFLLII